MNCAPQFPVVGERLDGRPVSAAFHLKVIEDSIRFMTRYLESPPPGVSSADRSELREACTEALDALAELRRARG